LDVGVIGSHRLGENGQSLQVEGFGGGLRHMGYQGSKDDRMVPRTKSGLMVTSWLAKTSIFNWAYSLYGFRGGGAVVSGCHLANRAPPAKATFGI
jgi:hypothetical protein